MQQYEFIKSHSISDALPQDPSEKIITADSFACALSDFLNEHFTGSLKVTNRATSGEWIATSTEYAALFFKSLLCYVYGREFLNISIQSEQGSLIINIQCDNDLPLTETEFRRLIKTARNAKMDICLTKKSISLSLCYTEGARYQVYAISFADGRHRTLSDFSEIFFSGAPITSCNDDNNDASYNYADTKNLLGSEAQKMHIQKCNNKKNKN